MSGRSALLIVLVAARVLAQRTPPIPGQLIESNGHRLHVDCRGNGLAVVFINGIPRFSIDWILVQEQVSKFARACTWDRGGEAWSDPNPNFSVRGTIADLEKITSYADAKAPVVLVAHSAGGTLSRAFAVEHKERVRALILIDATPDNGQRAAAMTDEQIAQFTDQAKQRPRPAAQIEPVFKKLPAEVQTAHSWASTRWWAEQGSQVAEGLRYQRDFGRILSAAAAKPHPLGNMPLIVITRATAKDDESDWVKQQRKLGEWSAKSTVLLAVGSSHDVQIDDPGLIASAIRSVLTTGSPAPSGRK